MYVCMYVCLYVCLYLFFPPHKLLQQLFGLQSEPAGRIAMLLLNYFHSFTPPKRVTTPLTLSDMLHQFSLPSQLTDCMLHPVGEKGERTAQACPVLLQLSPNSQQEELGECPGTNRVIHCV